MLAASAAAAAVRRQLQRTAAGGSSLRLAKSGRRHSAAAAAAPAETAEPPETQDRQHVQRLYDELRAKFGFIGAVDHKQVNSLDLFRILRDCKTQSDFSLGMQTMNVFYNYGAKLRHRELASRLLSAAMVCKVESEAVELIKLYGSWLQDPPDTALVYAVMGHFLDTGEFMVVREIAQAVREDWRMPVEPPLYALSIEAMLRLPERAFDEAMLLHEDAMQVGMRLPAPLHTRLLSEGCRAFELTATADDAEKRLGPLRGALRAAEGLASDGHLRGGASAASMCSLAWLFWHLERLSEADRAVLLANTVPGGATTVVDRRWKGALETAMENFGCRWGFSAELPKGLFRALEAAAATDQEVARLVAAARRRFGRFYPKKKGDKQKEL